jgi:cell division protein FtsB
VYKTNIKNINYIILVLTFVIIDFMRKFLSVIKNKYIIASLAFILIILFIDDTSVFQLYKMKKKHNLILLENKNKKEEIQSLKEKTKLLKTDKNALEKFARETYRMKKNDEVLYIIVNEEKLSK